MGEFFSLAMFDVLILIVIANGAPVIISRLLGDKLSTPVDLGYRLFDGQPILGDSKTWRGLIAALLATSSAAYILGYPVFIGLQVAVMAMLGDMFSSFIKRRFKKPSSSMVLVLDQVPESLFPLLLVRESFGLDYWSVMMLVALFIVVELSLSELLYRWGIRRHPY